MKRIMQLYKTGFRQTHNALCGPASMILATQALGFEEKHESEWLSPEFSKWVHVDDFKVRGMCLHELQFVSELIYKNHIEIQLKRAFPENFSLFLNDIEVCHRQENSILIINYRQDDFVLNNPYCEQGNPHYSPIANWNAEKKEILIADVDSVIEKPYWVKIEDMFKSMALRNPAIGIPRGWLVIKKRDI